MATLVIRDVEPELHTRLKAQAAAHGRSMEEEVRILLRQGMAASQSDMPQGFGQAMRALFEPPGGLELPELDHEVPRDPPDFAGPEWEPSA
jgi:plasmid stability protein